MVAWECLAGALPFTGTPLEVALAHAHRGLPPLPAGVPAGVAGLVAELTAKDPATRPASAAAVAARAGLPQVTVTACAAMPPGWPAAGQRARQPATLPLAGITMHDAPPLRPRLRPGHGRPGRATVLAATGVIAAVGLAAVLAAGTSGAAPPQPAQTGPSATAPAAPAARTVTVDNAALDGQPASTVLGQLRQACGPAWPSCPTGSAPRHRHHRAARRAGTGRRHGHGDRHCAAPWPQAPPARQRPWRRQRCQERGLARRGADDDGDLAVEASGHVQLRFVIATGFGTKVRLIALTIAPSLRRSAASGPS